jgi:hypothetical protein
MAPRPKVKFAVKHRVTHALIGHTFAVSAAQAVNNVWWTKDAEWNRTNATQEVRDRRSDYVATPVALQERKAVPKPKRRRRRRSIPGQLKLFRLS